VSRLYRILKGSSSSCFSSNFLLRLILSLTGSTAHHEACDDSPPSRAYKLSLGSSTQHHLERNVSVINHARLPVDDLKLSIEAIDSKSITPSDSVQLAAIWDPENIAHEEDWEKYVIKGGWLGCLLDATDEDAGKAWPDPLRRTPKSASSQWKGTLGGKYFDTEHKAKQFS
jgi:hypothetical protein